MNNVPKFLRTATTFAFSALLGAGLFSQRASAQAPYLLPYTIQTLAGTGSSASNTAAGAACIGFPGNVAYDAYGDGCPVSSPSVVVGTGSDIHDVVVDQQGNVFFIDNGSNGVVRRIDARSGVITVYYGSLTTQSVCSTTTDKYGDGCPANDGKANAAGGYTASDAKGRGLAVARNGDLYIASYSGDAIHRISLATNLTSVVAGYITGTGKVTLFTGVAGFTGDGGPAVGAEVNQPRGVAVDTAGNVYIADAANNVVRKVTASTGIISTITGSATVAKGFSGDGGPATAAILNGPEDIEVDASGNVFIADQGNTRVRVIYVGGTLAANLISKTNPGTTPVAGYIYTIIGNATPGVTLPVPSTTNSGPVLATTVPTGSARKISLDARDNIFFADNGNDVIWFLDASTGYMRVVAGTLGVTTNGSVCAAHTDAVGDNCPAANMATISPGGDMGVSVDAFGAIYITDTGDLRLRKVNTNQAFPAVAVGGTLSQILEVHYTAGDGPAAANPFVITGSADFTVTGSTCTVNSTSDNTQDCLVTVTYKPSVAGREAASLTIASVANGSSIVGLSGSGTAATVAIDPGAVSSFATGLKNPFGISQDNAGNTYVADTGNNRILRYTAAGAAPTVVAGTGVAGFSGDGALPTAATLNAPRAVAVSRNGAIYIADSGNNAIRRIDPVTGLIATVAGGQTTACTSSTDSLGDRCPGTAATFSNPSGLASDADGNVYIADTGNNVIRELAFTGYVSLVAGAGTPCAATGTNGVDSLGNNCLPTQTIFSGPTALVVDAARNIYIADTGDNEVRELVSSTNIVTRVAGNAQSGSSGNGGPAATALLAAPTGVGTDAAGNVYIADTGNAAIRVVSGGVINTIVGVLGTAGAGTLPGSAAAVQLTAPLGVFSNGAGRLIVLDSGNNRAVVDDRGSVSYNFGRTNVGTSSPALQIQETSTGSASATLGNPLTTNSGSTASFTLLPSGSTGCTAGQTLTPGANCLFTAQFTPAALGPVTATYTETGTNTINNPAPFITLSGTGATLTPTNSTTVINGSPSFAVPFTVTTTVVPTSCNTAAPSCVPTGTVTFFADKNQQGVPITLDPTGKATQTISGLTVGTHSITAVYSGDSFYAASSAPGVNAVIAQGTTKTTVSANPVSSPQFSNLVLTATVTGPTSNVPTGTIAFYAGSMLLNTVSVTANNGVGTATLSDIYHLDPQTGLPVYPQSFHLPAGTYALTAVYSGDSNYATSTSPITTLTISADPATFSVTLQTLSQLGSLNGTTTTGTAQGSTSNIYATVTAANTVNGTLTFACTGLPTYSVCTFSPTSLTFTPVTGAAATQSTQVTLWTDVPPGVDPTKAMLSAPGGVHSYSREHGGIAFATLAGWPVLLSSLLGVFAFRKRLRATRLLTLLALFGLLAGGSAVLSGCGIGAGNGAPNLTPTGTYSVKVIVSGPSGTSYTAPVAFTVGAGIPGQE